MATAAAEPTPPAVPDYLTNPNAVLGDIEASWRYGKPPDYSKTRAFYHKTKSVTHEAGSLPDLVQNLVKNWEIEASFKNKLADWRTINPDEYSFAINGHGPQSGEDMLRVGTYNAIIQPGNDFYSPKNSDFAQSHKTFKRMMPTFAWEVLDVIGAPPVVGIKWRHWGEMKEDYTGFNEAGEKVTAKAHGGPIDIQGTTWAWVDDQVRVKKLETWFDPMEMFRQIAPNGIVNKETVNLEMEETNTAEKSKNDAVTSVDPRENEAGLSGTGSTSTLEQGSAVAVPANDQRTHETYEEMNKITPMQCPFMNKE